MGLFHEPDPGRRISYDYCPPGSGDHYNLGGRAPMPAAVYPPGQQHAPGFWVHNLEHGYVAALYRCPSGQLGVGDCITRAEFEQLEQFFADSPAPQLAACPRKAVVVRFDSMNSDFALVAWNRALMMDEFNLDTALTFAQQWMEHVAVPENQGC